MSSSVARSAVKSISFSKVCRDHRIICGLDQRSTSRSPAYYASENPSPPFIDIVYPEPHIIGYVDLGTPAPSVESSPPRDLSSPNPAPIEESIQEIHLEAEPPIHMEVDAAPSVESLPQVVMLEDNSVPSEESMDQLVREVVGLQNIPLPNRK